eukprot:tig00021721_g23211.t1
MSFRTQERDRITLMQSNLESWKHGLRSPGSSGTPSKPLAGHFKPTSASPDKSFVSTGTGRDGPAPYLSPSPPRAPAPAAQNDMPAEPAVPSRRDLLIQYAPEIQTGFERLESGRSTVDDFVKVVKSCGVQPSTETVRLLNLFAKNGSIGFTQIMKSLLHNEEDSAFTSRAAGGPGAGVVEAHFYQQSRHRPRSPVRETDPLGIATPEEPHRPARKRSDLPHASINQESIALLHAASPSPGKPQAAATPRGAATAGEEDESVKAVVHDAIRQLLKGGISAAQFKDILQTATGRAAGPDVEKALARFVARGDSTFREVATACAPYFVRAPGPQDAESVRRQLEEAGLLREPPARRPSELWKAPPIDSRGEPLRMFTAGHQPNSPAAERVAGDVISFRYGSVAEGGPEVAQPARPATAKLQTPSSFDLISGRVDSGVVRHSDGLEEPEQRPARRPVGGNSPPSHLRAAAPARPVTAGCGDFIKWEGVDERAVQTPSKTSVHPRSAIAPRESPFATNYG